MSEPARLRSHVAHVAMMLGSLVAACGGSKTGSTLDDSLDVVTNSNDMGAVGQTSEGSAPSPRGRSRTPTLRESRVIDELLRDAEKVRRLRFKQQVPVLVQDRERITAYVESQIEEDELTRAHAVYTALGLLEATTDVRGLLLRLMGEQIVGYYDAKAKHLAVRDDVMRAFARDVAHGAEHSFEASGETDNENDALVEARIVLVHELVHALQDQHLGLSSHIESERDTDADNAFHALVEGDATLAMIGHALEREGVPLHRITGNPTQLRSLPELVQTSPLAGSELEQAPAIVRVPLLSAYVDGLAFCASLHGAADWAGVDRAFREPPASTEQILHPERFARRDDPTPLALPLFPQLAERGYEPLQDDTLGELEMRIYFGQAGNEAAASIAAEGWDGDRLRVYRKVGEASAVVWLSVWDTLNDAKEAEHAAKAVQAKSTPEVSLGAEVLRRDQSLLILRGLPEALRAPLLADFAAGKLDGSTAGQPPNEERPKLETPVATPAPSAAAVKTEPSHRRD